MEGRSEFGARDDNKYAASGSAITPSRVPRKSGASSTDVQAPRHRSTDGLTSRPLTIELAALEPRSRTSSPKHHRRFGRSDRFTSRVTARRSRGLITGSFLATCQRHSSRARYIRAGVRAAVAGPSGGRLDRRTANRWSQEVEKEGLWRWWRRKARGRATS